MTQLGFVFHGERCTGCGACIIACKEEKNLPDGVWLRTRKENPHDWVFLTQLCNHCDKPACMAICPVKAYHKEENGLVIQDHSKCIGCRACIGACPWHVPSYSKDEKKVYKCDGCIARLNRGEKPACLEACPAQAIEFGDISELRKKYPDAVVEGAAWAKAEFGYPDPKRTGANIVIVPLKSVTNRG